MQATTSFFSAGVSADGVGSLSISAKKFFSKSSSPSMFPNLRAFKRKRMREG